MPHQFDSSSSMPMRFPARKNTLNTWLMRLVEEFVHGRNRRRAHLGTQWANWTAHCFNQEGSRTQALQHRALSLLRPEQRLRATSCAESDMGIAKRTSHETNRTLPLVRGGFGPTPRSPNDSPDGFAPTQSEAKQRKSMQMSDEYCIRSLFFDRRCCNCGRV